MIELIDGIEYIIICYLCFYGRIDNLFVKNWSIDHLWSIDRYRYEPLVRIDRE